MYATILTTALISSIYIIKSIKETRRGIEHMKNQFANTELEMQLMNKRDPRSTIAASNISLHGCSVKPQSNTEQLLSDICEEENSSSNVDFDSYAFYIED